MKQEDSLNSIFNEAYKKENSVLQGLDFLINRIHKVANYESRGFNLLVSKAFKKDKQGNIKELGNSPYKRWDITY